MRIKCVSGHKKERGQGFMELAISLVFLLTLLAAVIDLGWAFYTMIALRDAAQEAAAYGALCPVDGSGNINYTQIRNRLKASATAPLNINDITDDRAIITFLDTSQNVIASTDAAVLPTSTKTAPGKGDFIRLDVTVLHKIMTPFVGTFIGKWEYPLNVKVSDTVLRDKCPVFSTHP